MTIPAKELTTHAKSQTRRPAELQTQPAATLRAFVTALGRLGYDTAALLAAATITRSQLDDPDGRLPCGAFPAVIGEAMRIRPLKNLGMRVAAETPIGGFQLLDYLVVTSENVGEGAKQLARYLRICEAPFGLEIRDHEDPVRLVYSDIRDPFTAEFEVALTIFHLRREAESELRAEYVSLTHTPDDVTEMEEKLGCAVHRQASWVGIALSRPAWQLPLRRRDPVLQSVLLRNADEIAARVPEIGTVTAELRRVLITRFAQGDSEIESVARSMATSVRSLQRRLAAAGTSYQEVLDSTRRDAAERYLSDRSLSISEIAYLLDYSEPAAFHRAFKRWHGSTPQEFRLGEVPRP
jgi:AraC-like DNA-binding protein